MPPERTEKLVQRTLDGKVASASSSKSVSKPSKSKSKSKGPPRVYTDAILTIQPKFADLILKKEKNHEFRKYHLREGVVRLWLYETAPTSALTYIIETGPPKEPGEVQDSTGIGNDDFDAGKKESKFGYPVLGLLRLPKALTVNDMEKYGLATPQGYYYATQSLVDGQPLDSMERVF
ncbi:hypothetical protein EYR40_003490 [Pleurotus pulmonarius]|nr:hypothetical protein EYR36_007937 [Pleurotus pulmonarius]KAF4604712.1 hypothetical protein EYR40_003490 [Pleurotus pulmonarius]KAF4606213.1 hypothetical protein EYR38_000262 [Pleurotus pulmonarius]